MNKRLYIVGALGIFTLVVIAILSVSRPLLQANDATVALLVDPSDALVKIDGQVTDVTKTVKLTAGSHSVSVAKVGYLDSNFTLTLSEKQVVTRSVQLALAVPVAELQSQQATAKAESKAGFDINARYPILIDLPRITADYRIDPGVSVTHFGDATAIAIYISANSQTAKQEALAWMKTNGFDAANYEIIYQKMAGTK